MDVQRKVKSMLSTLSSTEAMVKQATSLRVSNVSLAVGYQIATHTSDVKECIKIFTYILKRMNDDEKYIQHISNALQLTRMLLVFGSNHFFELMQSRRNVLECLKKYNTYNSDYSWVANKIRELANEVCQILDSGEYRRKVQNELKSQYDHDTHLSAFPSNDQQTIYDLKSGIYPKSREDEEAQLRRAIELSRLENERMQSSFNKQGRVPYENSESPDFSVCDDPFNVPRGYNQQVIPSSYSGSDGRVVYNRSGSMSDGDQRTQGSRDKLNFQGPFMEVNSIAPSSAQAQFDLSSQGYYPTAPYPSVDSMGGQSSNFHSSQSSQPFNSSFSSIPGMNASNDRINSSAFSGAPQQSFNQMNSQIQQSNPFGPNGFMDQSGTQNFERNSFPQTSQPYEFSNQNASFGQSSGMGASTVNDPFANDSNPFNSSSAFAQNAFSTAGGPSGMVDFKSTNYQQSNYVQQPGRFPNSNSQFTDNYQSMTRPPNNNNHQFGGNGFDQSQPFGSSKQPNNNNNIW